MLFGTGFRERRIEKASSPSPSGGRMKINRRKESIDFDAQYAFSTLATSKPSVSRYSAIAALLDLRTWRDT